MNIKKTDLITLIFPAIIIIFCVLNSKPLSVQSQTLLSSSSGSFEMVCVDCAEPLCSSGQVLSTPKDSCLDCPVCIDDCKCPGGMRFDGENCLSSDDKYACILLYDPVCGCNGKTYSNSCFANVEGLKRFTRGECSSSSGTISLTCKSDSDCPKGTCPNGSTYTAYNCLGGMCNQLLFFADPCQFLQSSSSSSSGTCIDCRWIPCPQRGATDCAVCTPCIGSSSSSGGVIQRIALSRNFTGIWRGRIRATVPPASTVSPGGECFNDICGLAFCRQNPEDPRCAPDIIMCQAEEIPVPCNDPTCNFGPCAGQSGNSGIITLDLCVKEGRLEGTVNQNGFIDNGIITSQDVITPVKVVVTIQDKNGKIETLTLKLHSMFGRFLRGAFSSGKTFIARKVNRLRSCTFSPCKNPCGEFCCNENEMCKRAGCTADPERCYGAYLGCEPITSSSSSGGGNFKECKSYGSCKGPNLEELPCPEGTFCSGLPAYGCYPPGCPTPICLSLDTRIRTRNIEKKVSEIKEGEIVLTDHEKPVKVIKTNKVKVKNHKILKVTFNDGTILEISPNHPTADGRLFKDLDIGDTVDNRLVAEVILHPYDYQYTYDILPDSETGNYYANGILVGSTLK